ncbi:hypothetical protein JCM33374_g2346 [Metschnikowia sp. JCM 33374]|nr:hypothetical protein JCM33374_g2346 [Metschnikowia sp. JCM 33374]
MSKPQKPVRQDYIAKVRYINNLPPPPLNPKFLKYNVTEKFTPKQESEYLLSSLFRKENFNHYIAQVDDEYGMSLNPLQVAGFVDGSKKDALSTNNNVALHSKDRALLRDAGVGKINKSEPGVSFLRRTEYIAERSSANRPEEKSSVTSREKKSDKVDADSQLQAVEQTFDDAQKSLTEFTNLRHPRKTRLRAVSTFPLLPDTSAMDTKYMAVKFAGSASMLRELDAAKSREKAKFDAAFHADALACAIYRPITSEDGEWVSFYQMKDKAAVAELRQKLDSTEKEQPANLLDDEESELPTYRFRHHKNYDMVYHRFSKPYEELALKFVGENSENSQTDTPTTKKRRAAFYCPISGRVELKKHRASTNTEINRFLDDSTMDVLNFKLREPNTNELKKMDIIRSEYDPMEYEGEDDEEEEEDEEDIAKSDSGDAQDSDDAARD